MTANVVPPGSENTSSNVVSVEEAAKQTILEKVNQFVVEKVDREMKLLEGRAQALGADITRLDKTTDRMTGIVIAALIVLLVEVAALVVIVILAFKQQPMIIAQQPSSISVDGAVRITQDVQGAGNGDAGK